MIMNISTIKYGSLDIILQELAKRVKQRRLELNLTQGEFAKKAGIGYDAYRNFETSGNASIKSIVQIAFVLDDVETINQLFTKRNYANIDEILKEKQIKKRQRASKNK